MPFQYNPNAIAADMRRRGAPMRVADFTPAARYGVNPAYAAAIAVVESEGGKTGYANKGTFNPYGWGVHQGFKYPSWASATNALAKGLSGKLYKGSGLTNPLSIAQRYAPSSDGNNPAGYAAKINALMKQYGASPNQLFGDQDPNAPTGNTATKSPTGGPPLTRTAASAPTLEDNMVGAYLNKGPGESWARSLGRTYLMQKLSGDPVRTAASQGSGPEKAVGAAASTEGVPATAESERAIASAKRHLGLPYSWGGGGPGGPSKGIGRGAGTTGFDCSGLTEYAWSQAGVKIGSWTGTQLQSGRGIDAKKQSAWLPGDLIFPHKGHVQLYLGNGKVIEAPRTGGHVQIVSVRSGTPYAVRRPRG